MCAWPGATMLCSDHCQRPRHECHTSVCWSAWPLNVPQHALDCFQCVPSQPHSLPAGKSYRKCEWLTEAHLREQRPHLITAYIRKTGNMGMAGNNNGIQPEWTAVERVFAVRPHPDRSGRKQYLVKWGVLGYNDSTWEDPEDLEKEQVRRSCHGQRATGSVRQAARTMQCMGCVDSMCDATVLLHQAERGMHLGGQWPC